MPSASSLKSNLRPPVEHHDDERQRREKEPKRQAIIRLTPSPLVRTCRKNDGIGNLLPCTPPKGYRLRLQVDPAKKVLEQQTRLKGKNIEVGKGCAKVEIAEREGRLCGHAVVQPKWCLTTVCGIAPRLASCQPYSNPHVERAKHEQKQQSQLQSRTDKSTIGRRDAEQRYGESVEQEKPTDDAQRRAEDHVSSGNANTRSQKSESSDKHAYTNGYQRPVTRGAIGQRMQ